VNASGLTLTCSIPKTHSRLMTATGHTCTSIFPKTIMAGSWPLVPKTADWLMVGMVPGLIICVPIAPPNSGDVRFCRPIGIYKPSVEDKNRYLRGEDDE
jgi:hypothetical protein